MKKGSLVFHVNIKRRTSVCLHICDMCCNICWMCVMSANKGVMTKSASSIYGMYV